MPAGFNALPTAPEGRSGFAGASLVGPSLPAGAALDVSFPRSGTAGLATAFARSGVAASFFGAADPSSACGAGTPPFLGAVLRATGPVAAPGGSGGGVRLIQADQQKRTIRSRTAAAGKNCPYQLWRGGSGVTQGWIGSETGSGSEASEARGAFGAT